MFYAELNELFTRELAEHGYSGVEVRVTPLRTEIIIRATRTQNVLGEGLPCFHCSGTYKFMAMICIRMLRRCRIAALLSLLCDQILMIFRIV